MFRTATTVEILEAVAVLVICALTMWSLGLSTSHIARAADLTNISDTLSQTAPNVASNHTITFVLPSGGSGVGAGETITVTFPVSTFDLSSIDADDMDFATSSDYAVQDGAASGATWGVATTTNTIAFTSGTETIAAGATVTIEVGTNATFGGEGNGQIVNPASSTYEINISTTGGDSGKTWVVILDGVDVNATMESTIDFAMTGVGAGALVNGTTTTGTSTPTTIPFGTLTPGVYSSTTAQDISVVTNAEQGYSVTVQIDGDLQSASGADIDGFNNGSDTNTPETWVVPSATAGSEATYGHWGVTSDDATTTRSVEFGSDEWIAASTTPRVVMGHDGPADGVTPGVGLARIGYTVSISSLQEAGADYSTTLTYVITSVF